MSVPYAIHRYALFHPNGTALAAGSRVVVGAADLPTPAPSLRGGIDADEQGAPVAALHVPLDDQPAHWQRLMAEHDHADSGDGAPHSLIIVGATPHPVHRHVLLGGDLAWGHDPAPAVAERTARLASLDDDALMAYLCGPEAPPVRVTYRPDVRLRLRTVTVHPRYDGSVVLASTGDVLAADGTPLGHGHTHTLRLPPNAWHGLTAPEVLVVAAFAHHAALGIAAPDPALPAVLHPHGYPSDVTRQSQAALSQLLPSSVGLDPAMRLMPRTLTLTQAYSGDLQIEVYAHLQTADGRDTGHRRTHMRAYAPAEWSMLTLPRLVAATLYAHHAVLGLYAPTPATVPTLYHTDPGGYPGTTTPHPVPSAPVAAPVDPDALRHHLATAKAAEMGRPIAAPLHPALGSYVPTPAVHSVGRDPRADEIARRNAYIAAHTVAKGV